MLEKAASGVSPHFAVLTYGEYAPLVKLAVALLDGLFWSFPPTADIESV